MSESPSDRVVVVVVADASPLIALATIGRLGLLRELFGELRIPEAVKMELCLDSGRPGAIAQSKGINEGWVRSEQVDEVPASLLATVDQGEAEAIALAQQLSAPLLIDEVRGRTAARNVGVVVFGSGAVLIKAKQEGLLAEVSPELVALSAAGYHLSSGLEQEIRRLAGE